VSGRYLFFERFLGTFAPFSRASDSAMAIACLRLFTRLPDRPDRSVPRLRRRIALSTVFEAAFPYRRRPPRLRFAIVPPRVPPSGFWILDSEF
jgi:hypothetical protein